MVLAPVFWLAVLSGARPYYQRHGEAIEQEVQLWRDRPITLLMIYVESVAAIWLRIRSPESYGGSDTLLLSFAALVAAPMLSVHMTRGEIDASKTALLLLLATFPSIPAGWVWLVACYGLWEIAYGALEHRRYRRLERRLAALRKPS